MAENAYSLGLGRIDVQNDTKTDIRITLDILGGATMQDPYAGIVITLSYGHC